MREIVSVGSGQALHTRSFHTWIRTSWKLSTIAGATGIMSAAIVGATVAYISLLAGSDGGGGRNFLTNILPETPTDGISILLVIGALFLVSSLTTSGSHWVQSLLLRNYIESEVRNAIPTNRRLRIIITRERTLTRAWVNLIISVFQPVVLLMVGAIALPGIPLWSWLGYAGLVIAVGMRHWRTSCTVSSSFLMLQAATRRERVPATEPLNGSVDQFENVLMLQRAHFLRDSQAIRLPPPLSLLFTTVYVLVFAWPVAEEMSNSIIGVSLIVLFLLHQKSIEVLTSLGKFAWALTLWRSDYVGATGWADDD